MFLKFQWYTFFPYQDIKQEVLLRSYLDSSSLFNHPLSHGRQEKKEGKMKIQNLNISRTKFGF